MRGLTGNVVRVASLSVLGRLRNRASHMQDVWPDWLEIARSRVVFLPSLTTTFVGMAPDLSRITLSSFFESSPIVTPVNKGIATERSLPVFYLENI